MATVEKGNKVQIHYTGRLEDGTVFDSSEGRDPLSFEAGSGQVIPGFDEAVVGMTAGEKKTITIAPAEAYGVHDPALLQTIPLDMLPDDVKVGDQLKAASEDQEFIVTVTEKNDKEAVVDANHPLAGKTLIFDLELVEIA